MKKSPRLLVVLLFVVLLPISADARHSSSVSTAHLGTDPVEEFKIPVLFAVEAGDVTPDFGAPRGGGTRKHEGQDFIAPKGTPIVSPTEAVVTNTGTGPSAGKFVYTANPGGETFRYMHLDSIADIERGDRLDVGDLIGTVGDTGNAPDGVYHLHFETRDEDNVATDPYYRLDGAFNLKDSIEFLPAILTDAEDSRSEYAEFLVETFPDVFSDAIRADLDLPRYIEDVIEDSEEVASSETRDQFDDLIDSIPKILQIDIKNGDDGAAVTLLQFYLIFRNEGVERDRLAAAGATGYYGSITEAAVRALQ